MNDASLSNPYLAANRAPVVDEVTAFDLPVTGAIPAQLEGRWLRNGPNPLPGSVDPFEIAFPHVEHRSVSAHSGCQRADGAV